MSFLAFIGFFILLYFILVFFVSRLVVPHMGYRKDPLPAETPEEMEKEIEKLKKKSKTKIDFLENTYNFLTRRYTGAKIKTVMCFDYLFKDVNWIWRHHGFQHCTNQNLMMRVFLVRSGFFKDEDIMIRHTFFDFDIHQYLSVNLNGKWIDIDLWGKFLGIKMGEHCSGFK